MVGSGCFETSKEPYYGYIEARLKYISSPRAGKVIALYAERGREVKAGDPLFFLEQEPEGYGYEEAKGALEEASANLADLEKGLRPTELDQIKAQIECLGPQRVP